jgi:deoxyribonuclease V
VPGLLSFRESPLVLAALEKLTIRPDLLMVDGQGYAHPRRFGIACHLGVLTDLPAIGVAKSVLVGQFEPPGPEPGDRAPLVHRGETVGIALRTKARTNPLIVSVGHKIDLPTAARFVLDCVRGYRLPETTRAAHRLAGADPADGARPPAAPPEGVNVPCPRSRPCSARSTPPGSASPCPTSTSCATSSAPTGPARTGGTRTRSSGRCCPF